MKLKTIHDAHVRHRRVLVRVDFNVPLQDGEITDAGRIQAALPTIRYLRERGACLVLCSHLGRPEGEVREELRLDPVADRLSQLLGIDVSKTDDCIGPEVESTAQELRPGDVLLLENTRFHPGEKANDREFAAKLARTAELYVNDAFAAAHRAHASTVGVAQHLLPAFAGLLMQREVETLVEARDHPQHPHVVVLGGAKISDKISVIQRFLDRAELLLLGGGVANTFLKARGLDIGESLADGASLAVANDLLADAGDQILMPVDVVVAQELESHAPHRAVSIHKVPSGWRILDIGPESIERYRSRLADAQMVIWNGPMGAYEWEPFDRGTQAMAGILADLTVNQGATTIVGGGETGAAVRQAGLADPEHGVTHVSTGGGAFLAFMEGRELPGIAYLQAEG